MVNSAFFSELIRQANVSDFGFNGRPILISGDLPPDNVRDRGWIYFRTGQYTDSPKRLYLWDDALKVWVPSNITIGAPLVPSRDDRPLLYVPCQQSGGTTTPPTYSNAFGNPAPGSYQNMYNFLVGNGGDFGGTLNRPPGEALALPFERVMMWNPKGNRPNVYNDSYSAQPYDKGMQLSFLNDAYRDAFEFIRTTGATGTNGLSGPKPNLTIDAHVGFAVSNVNPSQGCEQDRPYDPVIDTWLPASLQKYIDDGWDGTWFLDSGWGGSDNHRKPLSYALRDRTGKRLGLEAVGSGTLPDLTRFQDFPSWCDWQNIFNNPSFSDLKNWIMPPAPFHEGIIVLGSNFDADESEHATDLATLITALKRGWVLGAALISNTPAGHWAYNIKLVREAYQAVGRLDELPAPSGRYLLEGHTP